MSIWILKAIIQKSISFLPFKHNINFLFQKYVTKGVHLSDSLFADKLAHCDRHLLYFKKYSAENNNFTALEIGTGWYPIVPIGLYLYGAEKIYTIDISPLMNETRIRQTIDKIIQHSEKGFNFTIQQQRLDKLKQLAKQTDLNANQILEQMNIVSMIADARKIDLPTGSIDLLNSNNTFEHIYPEILIDILKEFKRIAKPGGVMSHAIDMSDHFSHLDKSITPYNFLKFSEGQWRWIDNSIQPQNRMRLYEHTSLYNYAEIPITEKVITGAGNDSIKNVALDKRFTGHDLSETAILHASIISKM